MGKPDYGKPMYSAPQLEAMDPGEIYSFTVNPKDEFQYFNKMQRYNEHYKEMYRRLTCINGVQYVDLHVELSSKGRLHWHGYLCVRDPLDFFMYGLHYLQGIGTYEIDTLSPDAEGLHVWDDYISKQDAFTGQLYARTLCKNIICNR